MNALARILPAKVRPPESRVSALGIDMGTTNSTVAEASWLPGAPGPAIECLAVEQEIPGAGVQPGVLVPSFVARHDGRVWVGEGARRLRAAEPGLERNERIFWECKNDIGLARTYHRAPSGFRTAAARGGRPSRRGARARAGLLMKVAVMARDLEAGASLICRV
jgi:hypothetical protein